MRIALKSSLAGLALALSLGTVVPAWAVPFDVTVLKTNVSTPVLRNWMSADVKVAWQAGFKGQGTTVTVIDDFTSRDKFSGNLDGKRRTQRHGEWTSLEIGLLAPSASLKTVDFNGSNAITLANSGLNVLNLSYGLYATAGYTVQQIGFTNLENSIVAAGQGRAVVAKAAGNDSIAVGAVDNSGDQDYLNIALEGGSSVLYVGALNGNGTVNAKTSLAYYSNYAGSDTWVQSHFITAGVEGGKTGLYGTSFAAPVIAGYAAILGSKFKSATATQITNQLLSTARTDTISNYSPSVYGVGEASLARALAPSSIR
jgi:subtilisin family serine protease